MAKSLPFFCALVFPLALGCPGFGNEEAGDVPDVPTYDDHVKVILDAHCLDCHVDPPANGAPNGMVLEQYEEVLDGSGGVIASGAGSLGCLIKTRAADNQPTALPPPPREILDPTSKAILVNWAATGRLKATTSPALEPCF